MTKNKKCTKCKKYYPANKIYFYVDMSRKSKLTNRCKVCDKNKVKKYMAEHPHPRLMQVYKTMLQRCNNPNRKDYKYYGGRGIKVKFKSFKEFNSYINDELKAETKGLTVDRINNDGHYEKGNIRFITVAENNRNRRNSKKAS